MKIYLLADLEGISGIGYADQIKKGSSAYQWACQLMMHEINVVINEAFACGVTELVVCDTHAGGGQLNIEQMDSRAIYERPYCGKLMPSLDDSFSGVILLGAHARAGTINGFLDHTINSSSWFEYSLNGQVLGEIGISAAYAGHYNVPVIMVSGDQAAAMEARELLDQVECAVVKWAVGRNCARCLPIAKAHIFIREAVRGSLNSIDKFKPYKPSLPGTIRLTLYRSDMADELASRRSVQRIDARTIEIEIESLLKVCMW